jgi:hypothetical protein
MRWAGMPVGAATWGAQEVRLVKARATRIANMVRVTDSSLHKVREFNFLRSEISSCDTNMNPGDGAKVRRKRTAPIGNLQPSYRFAVFCFEFVTEGR